MSIKVEGIELQLKTEASRAAEGAVKLETALKNLKATVKGGLGLSSTVEGLAALDKVLANLHLDKLKELTKGLEKLRSVKTTVKEASKVTSDVAPAKKVVSGESVSADSKAPADEKVKEVAKSLRQVTYESKKAFAGLTKLGAAIKRVFVYRMIRAAIKEVTKAFQEGIQNAYQYSKAISGPLAKNMDAIATSALFLKNGLGAAMAPIINALTPIVTRLADAVANLGNAIAGFFAMVTGQSTYVKAIKYATQYAEATEGAAKAQRQLLGFDELNVLTDKGGSGGSSMDYSKMFETVDTSTFKDNILKSLSEIPSLVGEKLKGALSTISKKISEVKWENIPGQIAEAIKKVFNGFETNEVIKAVGEVIGSAIAAAVSFGKGLAGTILEQFDSFIEDEFSNLDSDATILGIGKSFILGLDKGILDALVNLDTWIDTNITKPLKDGVLKGFRSVWSSVTEDGPIQANFALSKLRGWWALQKGKFFGTDAWKNVFKPIWEGLDSAVEEIKRIWGEVQTWLDEHGLTFKLNFYGLFSNTQLGKTLQTVQNVSAANQIAEQTGIKQAILDRYARGFFYAEGGYPAAGSMFVAGEAGPELVAQVGNRTGVINNDQFGSIVATAAENIINAILASGQATAEAAREGGNVYLDKTLVSRALYGSMQSEGTRKGGSAVQFVGV